MKQWKSLRINSLFKWQTLPARPNFNLKYHHPVYQRHTTLCLTSLCSSTFNTATLGVGGDRCFTPSQQLSWQSSQPFKQMPHAEKELHAQDKSCTKDSQTLLCWWQSGNVSVHLQCSTQKAYITHKHKINMHKLGRCHIYMTGEFRRQ